MSTRHYIIALSVFCITCASSTLVFAQTQDKKDRVKHAIMTKTTKTKRKAEKSKTKNGAKKAAVTNNTSKKTKNKKNKTTKQSVPVQKFVTSNDENKASMTPPLQPPQATSYLNRKLGLGKHSRIHISGFISAGSLTAGVRNSIANYDVAGRGNVTNRPNFEADSIAGLQVEGRLFRTITAVTQFVATGDDTNGNKPFRVTAQWAFIRFAPTHYMQIRVGRFRLPALLYSDVQQVGYSYPWVYLPNEVYQLIPADNLNGAGFIFNVALGDTGWVIKVQPFYGSNQSQITVGPTANPIVTQGTLVTFDEDHVYGGAISIGSSYIKLRAAYVNSKTSAFANLRLSPIGPTTRVRLVDNAGSDFFSIGTKVDWDHILGLFEFAQRDTPTQFPSLRGFYASFGYHFGQFLPIFTYGQVNTIKLRTLIALGGEFPIAQRSFTLGLDYYINSNIVSKVSVSRITPLDGTLGFFSTNPGRRHVMLYGVSLDAIF